MTLLRQSRRALLVCVLVAGGMQVQTARGQAKDQGEVARFPNFQVGCLGVQAGENERFLFVRIKMAADPSKERLEALRAFLTNKDNYLSTPDWTGAEGLPPIKGDNPPFIPLDASRFIYEEFERLFRVCLRGKVLTRQRGELHLQGMPEGWELRGADGKDPVLRYERGKEPLDVPAVRGKVSLGYGSGGPGVDINATRAMQDLLGSNDPDSTTVWTANFAAKLPIGRPNDAKGVGSESDGSGKSPDMLVLDLNRYAYSQVSGASRFGLRARASGSGEGAELTTYYAPFAASFSSGRAFVGAEGEFGYREGNHEFKTVTVKAPERGNVVARVGTVVEWAPRIGGVNKNLSQGLRFFVRGRGWLDYYENDNGEETVRFAPFLDSELFYNFDKDSRVFFRLEYGSLPPDLTRRISRIFVGVGQAF